MRVSARLYPLLVCCVLALAACGGGSAEIEPGEEPSGSPRATAPARPEAATELSVMFFGDSITSGYGLAPEQAFPARVQARIDERSWPVRVINAGLSGETSAGGARRVSWVLRQPVDVFVLELGGNDALRGVDLSSTRRNLASIIDTVRARNANTRIVIAGMMIPPNFGRSYAREFREMYPELAREKDAALIGFLMQGLAGDYSLMQHDGIHPTADGHEVMAGTAWQVLEPILSELLEKRNA